MYVFGLAWGAQNTSSTDSDSRNSTAIVKPYRAQPTSFDTAVLPRPTLLTNLHNLKFGVFSAFVLCAGHVLDTMKCCTAALMLTGGT
jgi:hypothetical protein